MLVDRNGALDYFSENLDVLWKVPLSVLVLSIYYGAVGVAISSLTSRRIVAGVAILGLALVPSAITGVLLNNNNDGTGAVAVLNLLALPLYLRRPDLPRPRRSRQPARGSQRSAVASP